MRSNGYRIMLRALRTVAVRCVPLLLLLLSACEKDGGTPSFVRFLAPTASTAEGDSLLPSAVSDFWVFANDEAIGVWQENRRIPVLADGLTNIKVVAGVRRNGITNDRIQYPFYATWEKDVDLTLGQETILEPEFTYYDAPIWVEGFELAGQAFDYSESDTIFVPLTAAEDVRYEERSGGIFLDADHDQFRAVTNAAPTFPNGTAATFLEFDHKSDTRFLIGVRYTTSQNGQTLTVPYVVVNPTGPVGGEQPWKHMYIDLSSAWGTGGTVSRQFYIEAQLENGATSARIVLDHLTVHH